MENPWPNLGSQPEAQAKRNNFPKAQNRVGRPNASKKVQSAKNNEPAQQSSNVKSLSSTDPDFDITPPTAVIEPNEPRHNDIIANIQAEIVAGEKRLVVCLQFLWDLLSTDVYATPGGIEFAVSESEECPCFHRNRCTKFEGKFRNP